MRIAFLSILAVALLSGCAQRQYTPEQVAMARQFMLQQAAQPKPQYQAPAPVYTCRTLTPYTTECAPR